MAERNKLAFAAACLKAVDHQEYARQGQIESLSCRRRANAVAPIGIFSRLWDQTLSPIAYALIVFERASFQDIPTPKFQHQQAPNANGLVAAAVKTFVRQATNTLGIEDPRCWARSSVNVVTIRSLHFAPHSVHQRHGKPRVRARASDFIRNVDALSEFAQNMLLRGLAVC